MTHPSKMNFEAWCHHVTLCAETMTRKMVNFREIQFAWAERYQDNQPLQIAIDALVAAGAEQVAMAARGRFVD